MAVRRITAGLVSILVLASCGSGSGGAQYGSAEEVAAAFGCNGYKAADQSELYAADTGGCRFQGHLEDVNWFLSHGNAQSWLDAAGSFGGSIVHGDTWAISCSGRTDCVAIQKKIGGTVD